MAMKTPSQLLGLLLLVFITCVSANPRLGVVERRIRKKNLNHVANGGSLTTPLLKDLKTFNYTQTLDHFNFGPESYNTFQQRYVINFKHWGGANSSAPIFVYFGAEASLDGDLGYVGFLNENSPRFKALELYIEHRFYGHSVPYGSIKEALQNTNLRGYFSSSQALADYAEVINYVKKNLSAEASPVIVIGGSYGGMLASWFRLKYPHIARGALASSAPILYFDNIVPEDSYYSLVTKVFREASENCYNNIKQVWSTIDDVAAMPNGLKLLSEKFKTCSPLSNSSQLKDYLDITYAIAAQYNRPRPPYQVSIICKAMDEESSRTIDVLSRVFAGVVAFKGNESACYDMNEYTSPSETNDGWNWQTCSEMVMPIAAGTNSESMFPPKSFNLTSFMEDCKERYGVSPRPHWITTQFGGHDIKRVLQQFGSNIIFSNGLKDPYSSGGVLENISPSLIVVTTKQGSHCLDLGGSSPDDPKWLTHQRKKEVKIIGEWLRTYYMDLKANI